MMNIPSMRNPENAASPTLAAQFLGRHPVRETHSAKGVNRGLEKKLKCSILTG